MRQVSARWEPGPLTMMTTDMNHEATLQQISAEPTAEWSRRVLGDAGSLTEDSLLS